MAKSTHGDLARELHIIVDRLERTKVGELPAQCATDPSSLRCITDAARILIEQDERIAELTIALRNARASARKASRRVVTA
jgi:hypothetical protein